MLHRLRPLRLIVALVAALLVVGALQSTAEAATKRSLTVAAGPTAALVKGGVTFSGKLSKSPKGSKVTIQRKSGKKWVAAKTAKTKTAAGAYSVRIALPAAAGTYAFRAVAPKKGKLKAATSRTISVSALRKVAVTIKATPGTVNAGSSATLSGTVRPFVKNTTITLQKLVGAKWVTATTTTLNTSGNFSKPIALTASTIFRASAPRAGINGPGISLSTSVIAKPVISTTSLNDGFVGGAYSLTLHTLGNAQGTWSAAPLPAGLTLNAGTGVISGTPTTAETKQVVVGFAQAQTGLVATPKTLALEIIQPVAPTITTATLPDGLVGDPYTTTLTAGGGATGTWSTSALPAGLTLVPSTGVISGTPSTGGTTAVTINFTQTGNPLPAVAVVRNLKVNTPKPAILTTSLPDAKIGAAYSATLHVSGNVAGTWTVTGFPAASGLSVNPTTGVISGTAFSLIPATATLTVNFTDGTTSADPVQLSLRIANANPNHAKVASGGQYSCRINTDGNLSCWGYDESGQLGSSLANGVDTNRRVLKPGPVGSATDWSGVTTGGNPLISERHTCAIRGTTGYCWGSSKNDELGAQTATGNSSAPLAISGGHAWSQLSAGFNSTCGVTTGGALYCWGGNSFGQLGIGSGGEQSTPTRVGTQSDWTQVAIGYTHTCATKADHTLWCWGFNFRGQLGNGTQDSSGIPVQVVGGGSWAQVAVNGSSQTCATRTDGTLWCWGFNAEANYGTGGVDPDASAPVQVGTASTWSSLAMGNGSSCAVNTTGNLYCWGANSQGQLGLNDTTPRTLPTKVGTGTDWESVSVGDEHACAVKDTGAVLCWGSNANGQLGINASGAATARSLVPVAVIG
jgi:alpha-tubulin suppressor-like RCC1 family protein